MLPVLTYPERAGLPESPSPRHLNRKVMGSAAPHERLFPISGGGGNLRAEADTWGQKLPQPLKGKLFPLLNHQLEVFMPLLRPPRLN